MEYYDSYVTNWGTPYVYAYGKIISICTWIKLTSGTKQSANQRLFRAKYAQLYMTMCTAFGTSNGTKNGSWMGFFGCSIDSATGKQWIVVDNNYNLPSESISTSTGGALGFRFNIVSPFTKVNV